MTLARGGRRRLIALAGLVSCVAAGCSSSDPSGAVVKAAQEGSAPLPATAPYLAMTGPSAGWLVWRSGPAWLLLRTTDGFRHVTNRTPIAVPTDGGLVAGFDADRAAVAIGASERLLSSPLLTSTAAQPSWTPLELPGAVADARAAVATGPSGPTAVTRDARGTVLAASGGGWRRVTDGATLSASGGFTIDSVVLAGSSLGWLTGHGTAGAPKAFRTVDGGSTWTAVPEASSTSVAALAPCGSGRSWLLPVLAAKGTMTIIRTSDGGTTWTAGARLQAPSGEPAWGCRGAAVWMVGRANHADHVFASGDGGGTWSDRGTVPTGLTDLAPVGAGRGFAVSGGKHPVLWRVAGDGATFTAVPLPAWVAALGTQMADH